MGFWSTLGGIAKTVAPALAFTGVGAPLAAGIGAAGKLLQDGTDDDPNTRAGIGSVVSGAAPAAVAGLAQQYMGSSGGAAGGGVGPDDAGNLAVDAASSAGAQTGGMVVPGQGIGSRLMDAGRGAAGWIESHPTLAGAALSGYGAYQEGRAVDRQNQLYEDELERRRQRQDNLDPILAGLTRSVLR